MKVKPKSRKRDLRKAMSVNLPEEYPWKVLNKVANDLQEYLTEEGWDRIAQIIRNRDLDAYLQLSEDWGLQCISPSDNDVVDIRCRYLLASLIKKFQFPTDKESRVARALEIFSNAESQCQTYNLSGYKSLSRPETEWGVEILHYARQFLVKLLGAELPGSKSLLDRSRHGPGATIGTSKGNTSRYHKFAEWPYTCTIDAYRYARFAIETDPRWFGALQNSYRARFGIQKHYPLDMQKFWTRVIKIVDANRIAFVPKDARKERTIAIEPLLNLYLQLGVDGYIRRRLKRFGVNLDDQTKNQKMAREGSLQDGENSFVTVDLSAASDSLSLKACETLLPPQWYSYLCDLRSPKGDVEGSLVEYQKISSMGNGYTFALESAIFAALVYAVMKAGGGTFNHAEFAVYGDDIIVQKRLYFRLVEALRLSGFSVNLEKTFTHGPIRESCGTDWFHGMPLRPVFLTKTPANATELFTDYNRLKRLLSLRFGIEEPKVLLLLSKWVPDAAKKLVGPYSDEDFSSYMHTAIPPVGWYKNCVYRYRRLVQLAVPRKGKDFLLRKLMHDLRGSPLPLQKWDLKTKVSGKGGRFTVTSRNAITMGYTYSESDIWTSTYDGQQTATCSGIPELQ